jgi:hypothetical protein
MFMVLMATTLLDGVDEQISDGSLTRDSATTVSHNDYKVSTVIESCVCLCTYAC